MGVLSYIGKKAIASKFNDFLGMFFTKNNIIELPMAYGPLLNSVLNHAMGNPSDTDATCLNVVASVNFKHPFTNKVIIGPTKMEFVLFPPSWAKTDDYLRRYATHHVRNDILIKLRNGTLFRNENSVYLRMKIDIAIDKMDVMPLTNALFGRDPIHPTEQFA